MFLCCFIWRLEWGISQGSVIRTEQGEYCIYITAEAVVCVRVRMRVCVFVFNCVCTVHMSKTRCDFIGSFSVVDAVSAGGRIINRYISSVSFSNVM